MTDQRQSRVHTSRKITPLLVFAIFVGLTETIAGLVAWQGSGTVQLILTYFVVGFPILVLVAFVWLLWHRPYVLYGPAEFGDGAGVGDYVRAMRGASAPERSAAMPPASIELQAVKEDAEDMAPQALTSGAPAEPESWVSLWRLKRYDDAAREIVETASATGMDIRVAHAFAGVILLEKNRAEGLSYYETLFQQYPADSVAYVWLASTYVRTAEFGAALDVLDRGCGAGVDPTALATARSRILVAAGRVDEAIDVLRSADPGSADSTIAEALGQVFESADRSAEAIAVYESALVLHPRNEFVLSRLVALKSAARDHPAELFFAQRLVETNKSNASYLALLGNAHLNLEMHGKALLAYEQANALADGKEGWIRANIGNIMNNRGFSASAVLHLKAAVELDKESTYAIERLAMAMKAAEAEDTQEAAVLREYAARSQCVSPMLSVG